MSDLLGAVHLPQLLESAWPLLEVLQEGVAMIGPDGTVLRFNGQFRQLVGRDQVRAQQANPMLLEQCQAGVKTPGQWQEVRLNSQAVQRLVLPLVQGADAGWLLMLRDVSGEVAAQDRLRAMLDDARASRRRWIVGLALFTLLIGAGVAGLGYASNAVSRQYHDTPYPNIRRAATAEALKRGQKLYESSCIGCHSVEDVTWAASFQPSRHFASVVLPNVSSDETSGVGAWTDEELARMLRYNVRRDGTLGFGMPGFDQMGDEDVAAIIAFMRSDNPYFSPEPVVRSRPELSWVGRLYYTFVVGLKPLAAEASVETPKPAPTAEYGKYMANGVYQCFTCHTEGGPHTQRTSPLFYAGGVPLKDNQGRAIYSTNLTPDPSGIGAWNLVAFSRAVRDGVGPDGLIVQPPMRRWRLSDNTEVEALYKYFQSLPPVKRPNVPGGAPMQAPAPTAPPPELFNDLGCRMCHGWKPPYDNRVRQAAEKPTSQVAAWIRNPQQFKPGTQMPTYADLISDDQALALAEWVQKVSVARPDVPQPDEVQP